MDVQTWALTLLQLLGALLWAQASNHPMWVLEHPQNLPPPITFLVRHNGRPATAMPQRRHMMPRRVQLPHRYVQHSQHPRLPIRGQQLHPSQRSPAMQYSWHTPGAARQPRRRQPQALPIFDDAPGDNALPALDNYPLFVYNGTKGELIVNTMLSAQRYPMQEPVPGQVLYPPSTPMFRPKPIVERFRVPGQTELLNLTLIPFYAHEAIRSTTTRATTTSTRTTTTTTTTTTTPKPETQVQRNKRKKRKKAKQYNAYHSAHDVQWQPENHRQLELSNEEEPVEPLQLPVKSLELLSAEEQMHAVSRAPISAFHIVYVDESLERPALSDIGETNGDAPASSTEPTPRQSSRYALKRGYYAFPVYTLGKLLQPPKTTVSSSSKSGSDSENSIDEQRDANTWFILNSRYKGPHRKGDSSQMKYYTSKYIQNAIDSRP